MICPTCESEMMPIGEEGLLWCSTCGTIADVTNRPGSVAPTLVERVREYQHNHDLYGDGDIRTGKAWDKMRECVYPPGEK